LIAGAYRTSTHCVDTARLVAWWLIIGKHQLSRQVPGARSIEQQREYSHRTCTNHSDIDAVTVACGIYRLNCTTSRKFDA
jgi:hypothetical protein